MIDEKALKEIVGATVVYRATDYSSSVTGTIHCVRFDAEKKLWYVTVKFVTKYRDFWIPEQTKNGKLVANDPKVQRILDPRHPPPGGTGDGPGTGQPRKTKTDILRNRDLDGQFFQKNIDGYEEYLIARRYEAETTVRSYVYAISRIREKEGISFTRLLDNAYHYVKEYSQGGIKEIEGKYGHATWVNALKRLDDFSDYIKGYMKGK